MKFTLRIPASEPLVGRCRVAEVKPLAGNVRIAFRFEGLDQADRDRVETFVFDTVLGQLAG